MVNTRLPAAIIAWQGGGGALDFLRKSGCFQRQSIPKQTARIVRKFLPHLH
jgi:hypothetical protein